MPKRIFISAGPNGAGKTTFASTYLRQEVGEIPFLNADNLAADICPEAPESVAVAASRRLLELISALCDSSSATELWPVRWVCRSVILKLFCIVRC